MEPWSTSMAVPLDGSARLGGGDTFLPTKGKGVCNPVILGKTEPVQCGYKCLEKIRTKSASFERPAFSLRLVRGTEGGGTANFGF